MVGLSARLSSSSLIVVAVQLHFYAVKFRFHNHNQNSHLKEKKHSSRNAFIIIVIEKLSQYMETLLF